MDYQKRLESLYKKQTKHHCEDQWEKVVRATDLICLNAKKRIGKGSQTI